MTPLHADLAKIARADARDIETAEPRPLDEARAAIVNIYGPVLGTEVYAHALKDLRAELHLGERRAQGEHLRLRDLATRLEGAA